MRCEYCNQPMPRVIQVGDLVQRRDSSEVGVAMSVGCNGALASVVVIGARTNVTRLWQLAKVDLIHGTIHVTERL